MNSKIYSLVGDENAVSLDDLLLWMEEAEVSQEDLENVLCDELIGRLKVLPDRIEVPPGDAEEVEKGRTEVYLWGQKGSGKSAVIGSVLSCQPECWTECGNSAAAQNRAQNLCKAFADTGKDALLPDMGVGYPYNVIKADIRDTHGKVHPLAFIEMQHMLTTDEVLSSQNDKIHILCYDCREAGEEQDKAFISLLEGLKTRGVLDRSVGVYLVVTKTDSLTNVPYDYRPEVAQTMITADHVDLWTEVKNVCYIVDIFDATPIPYSVGDVKLQKLVKINLADARLFIEKPLCLKSHTYRSWLSSMLRAGSWWSTGLLLTAACAVLIYLAYLMLSKIDPTPTAKIMPFDYQRYIEEQDKSKIKGGSYLATRRDFDRLANDVNTERHILLADGKSLLRPSEYTQCYELIYNDFAGAVLSGFDYEFSKTDWSDGILEKLYSAKIQLTNGHYLSNSNKNKLDDRSNTYLKYKRARELVRLSKDCTSVEDVNKVVENVSSYKYDDKLANNTSLIEELDNAKDNAYESCARSLLSRATSLYRLFVQKKEDISRRYEFYEIFSKSRATNNLVDEFLSGDEYKDLKQQLNRLDDMIVDSEEIDKAKEMMDRIR